MQRVLFLIPVYFFFISIQSTAQRVEGKKIEVQKQAVVDISKKQQVKETTTKMKDPNRVWKSPNWSYANNNVIYRQPKNEIKISQNRLRETSPEPDTTFPGIPDNGVSIPPDVNAAAGPDHLMQTLNTEVRITDKSGNNLFTTTLSAFWSELPGNNDTFDPKIVYDPYSERWIMITPSNSSLLNNKMYLGVSLTSDPMGEWIMYWFDPDPSGQTWFDYPNLGFNKNWISIGGILRDPAFEPIHYVVYAIDKTAAFAGDEELVINQFKTSIGSAIVPSFTYDPDQEEMHLISTGPGNDEGNGYINLFKMSGPVADPVFELKGSVGISEPWENWSYEYDPDFLPQMDSEEKLNSVDARMHTMINRNNKLWAVHHIYLPANNPERCAIQWWNLDTTGAILQRGRIDDPENGHSFAYPSIAVNAHEDVFIGHGVFSENQYAGAAYSFKAYFDEDNSMRDFYQYKEGLAPYYKVFGGNRNRWGDYSAVFVDPVLDVNFWATHEYAELPSGGDQWGTWWAYYRPSFPPEADFGSDEIIIPPGETVNFHDLTVGVPTEWQWDFAGGTPESSSDENPQNILYDKAGFYDVRLIVNNDLGVDTVLKTGYIVVDPGILPHVDFEADAHAPCLVDTVSFIDLSKYSPIQWDWQFSPSTVTFVNGTDHTSQNPQLVFNEVMEYDVSLTVWNLNGDSESTKVDMIFAGGYQPWFKETFEIETFNSEEWTIENPDQDVTWEFFEVGGTEPGSIATGVDFSQYFAIGQRDRLISPAFSFKDLSSATLQFEHAYAGRYMGMSDSLMVFVSSDCGESWVKIFSVGEDGEGSFATHLPTDGDFWPAVPGDWCMTGWGSSCSSLDLTPWVGLSNVKIAFETYSSFGNPLMIDNIEISQFVGVGEELTEDEIKVYPVPAKGNITVLFPEGHNFTELELSNQLGQRLFTKTFNANRKMIEIERQSNWAEGMYYLKVTGKEFSIVKQVIFH